ncbi:hypothetical protein ANO11243_016900 [Dothideomycetidae sp. 11243]|nr:hypothetical protein ANO11243_016900 [fungal sp. No.11243]
MEDSDQDFFTHLISADETSHVQAFDGIPAPVSKRTASEVYKWFQSCLLGVIICLKPSDKEAKPVPIGYVALFKIEANHVHHRHTTLALSLLPERTGRGYGKEAILWALEWAFHHANMHRVGINAYSHNVRAVRLYERLGFVMEGREREMVWLEGRYWDLLHLGMLGREWRELYGKELVGA